MLHVHGALSRYCARLGMLYASTNAPVCWLCEAHHDDHLCLIIETLRDPLMYENQQHTQESHRSSTVTPWHSLQQAHLLLYIWLMSTLNLLLALSCLPMTLSACKLFGPSYPDQALTAAVVRLQQAQPTAFGSVVHVLAPVLARKLFSTLLHILLAVPMQS